MTQSTDSLPKTQPLGFHVIAKPAGPICNLDCSYCFYLEKERLYPEVSRWTMSSDALEAFIRKYIAAQPGPTVSFTWQGGEPTLAGLDFFRNVVTLQEKYGAGRTIENSLQTNAVALDDHWCEFLAERKFLVGVSIDGPRHLHDALRTYKGGRGSFDDTLRGIRCLQKHRVEFNTLTVVSRANGDHGLEVYRFLKEIGSRFLQFLPAAERIAKTPLENGLTIVPPSYAGPTEIAPWSVEPLQFGYFLREIFDHWVRHDVARTFVQIFDVALENQLGLTPALCVFRETCGGAMAVEHNGDLYSCDHYVFPEYRLGNLQHDDLATLVDSPAQTAFGNAKRDALPEYCRKCDVLKFCRGECPKHRFIATPDGEPGLNYLCEGYKLFFRHALPAMEFMAGELRAKRPPANVMAWMAQRDASNRPIATNKGESS